MGVTMNPASVRSTILGAAAAAAVLDVIVIITALVAGAVLPAVVAILAGIVCVGGAGLGASRVSTAMDLQSKQLERANSQVETLTHQLADVAEYLNQVGGSSGGEQSQAVLESATNRHEDMGDGSHPPLDKAEQARAIAEK